MIDSRRVNLSCAVALLLALLLAPSGGSVALAEYERPVNAAPKPADIGEDYALPATPWTPPRAAIREILDVAALAAALGVGAWLVLWRRSRGGVVALSVTCLLYFGFYRKGCLCPIGAIQNVAVSLTDAQIAISYIAIAIFFLPLIAALLFGRVFCSGVCPLGAVQELLVLKPVTVPRRLDRALGWLRWVYLILAVWWATRPAPDRDFIICRLDPFVGFFRFTGSAWILFIGGGLLVLNLWVGRPYCRYVCPYGALLGGLSRLAWRPVQITADRELDCGLCAEACPYGAIEDLRAKRASCVACARCYAACPHERIRDRQDAVATTGAES